MTTPGGAGPGDPPVLHRVGRMCLALPSATVKISHGSPAYQVGGRNFATTMNDHHGSGRIELWVRGKPGAQQEWMAADPERYYRPAYVGPSGWVGVWLDVDVDWAAIAELLVDGYLDRLGPRKSAGLDPATLVASIGG